MKNKTTDIYEMLRPFQVLCKLKKTDIRCVVSYSGQSRFLRFCPCLYYNAVSGHVKQGWPSQPCQARNSL